MLFFIHPFIHSLRSRDWVLPCAKPRLTAGEKAVLSPYVLYEQLG